MHRFKDYQWDQYVTVQKASKWQEGVAGGIALDALRIRRHGGHRQEFTENLLDRLTTIAEGYETDARDTIYLARELLELWRQS